MRDYEQQHGTRILDYLDLHYYPQAQGVALHGAGDARSQALRLRSTRSLWDPTYIDESWIGEPVRLDPAHARMGRRRLPRHQDGASPSTTGARWTTINGALAQADVLGIFGREGLDLATLWAPPSASHRAPTRSACTATTTARAAFGDTSLRATSADPTSSRSTRLSAPTKR